jgi:hypothetical protein
MSRRKIHLQSTILSAAGFGGGFALGAWLSNLIFSSDFLNPILSLSQTGRLIVGLALVLVVAGVGGAIAGAIGGLTLSYAHQSPRRAGYVWRSALSFGVGYALVVIPLTLAISLMSFNDLAEASPIGLMIPLWVMGAIFGAVSGLILGLLTVGRDTWRVFLVGTVAFAFGGSGLGYGFWNFLSRNIAGDNATTWSLVAGVVIFGAIGGGSLGFLYSWLAHRQPAPSLPARLSTRIKQLSPIRRVLAITGLVILALLLRALWIISPFSTQPAQLASTLESNTVGTHWAVPVIVSEAGAQPALAADAVNAAALVWSRPQNEGADVFFATRSSDDAIWSAAVNVSNSAARLSHAPQLAFDSQGNAHLVWVEAAQQPDASEILYSRCQGLTCSSPVSLSSPDGVDCLVELSAQNDAPGIAIDGNDRLMVVWRNGESELLFSTGQAGLPLPGPAGCIPIDDGPSASQPRLAGSGDAFGLVFEQDSRIYLAQYAGGNWSIAEAVGSGSQPEIFFDADSQLHLAWCGLEQRLVIRLETGQPQELPNSGCLGRPALGQNNSELLRLVWLADEVQNVAGVVRPNAVIYESSKTDAGWTEPAIIAQTSEVVQPALASDGTGMLHLAWIDASGLNYATHTAYDCSDADLSPIGQTIYDAVRQAKYRPTTDNIPYCNNQYDNLIHVPNPLPAYSEAPPTPNGPYDKFAQLAQTAQYEVVFATMWYDGVKQADSPGRVLAQGIAGLYQKLKADPSRYPRGLTVRILLGNPPGFGLFPNLNHQVWRVMDDLQAAGIPELRNDEIGWNLEVANFSGAWPHSHTKLMIVDGKVIQVPGYNMQHTHLPKEHPSGKGQGRVDLGMQVTGPAAQTALRAYDDLWQAATHIHCPDLTSGLPIVWMLGCQAKRGVPQHVPEVLRYYVPDESSNAFSIYRSNPFRESDEAYAAALASATSSIDTIHINFSLELVCALNLFIEACNYANRLDYMEALMQAVEKNDVEVRILVSDVAWVGLENNIAIKAFEDERAARGLSDNVEIRYFEQDMHMKSALIDDEFLIVGNQNFHYSAWNSGGLTEFNVGVEAPQAVQDYQRFFNYYWDRAKRRN